MIAVAHRSYPRGPDAELLKAAESGKLHTREDYHREVTRLLNDKEYYKGSVDPAFSTGKVTSHVTSHPRINRFFRDRFGLARLFLHAETMRVLHPREPRYLELSSPLPAELASVLDALRGYQGPVV